MKKKGGRIFFEGSKMKSIDKVKRSILEGVRKDSPSLLRAYQLTKIASQAGFDWPNIAGVLKKLDEEIEEFKEALSLRNRRRIMEELGDLLFVLTNIARFLHINPEEALRRTLEKFTMRFHYIETSLRKKGKSLHQSNLIEMDRLWEEAKKKKTK
jgi:tetrapyrrole methylase family protein/MazG family protein